MKSHARKLTRTYILALFAVALTTIVGQVVIQSALSTAESDGHAINLAGRQRMLSERIVKSALLSQTKDLAYAKRLVAVEKLNDSIDLLRTTHSAFRFGDAKLEIEAIKSPALLNLFDELQPLYEAMLDSGKRIAAADVEQNANVEIATLEQEQQQFVVLMNEIVIRMSRTAADKIGYSSNLEYWLMGTTMFLLMFEGFFVFHPAVKQVKKAFKKLTERDAELLESERQHRDLFQFSAGPLLCLHPDTGRIISANPAASDALRASSEKLCGKRFHSFLSSSSAKTFDDCLGKLDGATTLETLLTISTCDTNSVWASRCVIYRNENEIPYVLLSGHDVTEQVDREQQLILANQRDDLTGLFRRAELDLRLQEMAEEHQTNGTPFVVAMIDIDHFKSLNDKFGHQCGDEVLKVISRTIQDSCRQADVVARYGGEEISVLFPRLSCQDAAKVTNRLREKIENLVFKMTDENDKEQIVKTSVSIGVAGVPLHAHDAEEVMKAADDAMYQAKCAGRNRVCIYSETAERKVERRQQSPPMPNVGLPPLIQPTQNSNGTTEV